MDFQRFISSPADEPDDEIIRVPRMFGPQPEPSWHGTIALAIAAFALSAAIAAVFLDPALARQLVSTINPPPPPVPREIPSLPGEHFSICSGPVRITCVVDGDTVWLRGEKIRIADINAPEVSSPSCSREAELGRAATVRLADLMSAGPFVIEEWGDRDTDVFDRKLRVLKRDGQSLGEVLVAEGLAHRWRGQKESWC